MREETRARLERQLWMERAKKAGIGLAIAGAIGLVFAYQNLDLSETAVKVSGTIVEIDPLVSKTSAADGESVQVKLETGRLVTVLAQKSRALKAGDKLEITEHRHGSGRVTYTLK